MSAQPWSPRPVTWRIDGEQHTATSGDSKLCENCGERYYRKRQRGPESWATSRFCNTACRTADRKVRRSASFWTFVEKADDGCWIWRGNTTVYGYGQFSIGGSCKRAHRFAYDLAVGPIPDGLMVLHSCDVRTCVNPAHLSIGSHLDNMQDMRERGRAATGYWARDRVIDAMRSWHREYGVWPNSTMWKRKCELGSRPTNAYVMKVFGKWSTAVATARGDQ